MVKDHKVIKVFRVHKVIKVFKDHTVTKVFKVHKLGDQGQGTGIHQGPTGCIGFNIKVVAAKFSPTNVLFVCIKMMLDLKQSL